MSPEFQQPNHRSRADVHSQHISDHRLQLLIESARDYAIFSTDAELRVNYWSSGAQRLFGYTESEIIGQSVNVLFTPEDRAINAAQREAEEAMKKGRAEDERWHLRRDQTRSFASGILSPLRTETGEVIGFVKIARDLTERKLSAENLQRANEELAKTRDTLERRVEERTAELNKANGELHDALQTLQKEIENRAQADVLRHEAIQRMLSVQEDERRRISRELHDHLGQQVTALSLGLNALNIESPDISSRLVELRNIAETLGHDLHTAAFELRPTALDDVGLDAALGALVQVWSRQFGIGADLHVSGNGTPRLNPDIESSLYRIVQEALNNVAKHASATQVNVVVTRNRSEVRIVIEDNGRGFEADAVTTFTRPRLGLLGMNERAAQFGGDVTVESSVGGGASVFVRIPL